MNIHKPGVAAINLTPLSLVLVVTVNISAPANAVAPDWSVPAAVATVTSLIMCVWLVILPDTVKLVNVPTAVMFGCVAPVISNANAALPADVAYVAFATTPEILAAATLDNPPPSPVNNPVFAVNDCAVTIPLTPNTVIVPTEVIFGCADVVTVPDVVADVALVANATVPETLAPATEFATCAKSTSPVTCCPSIAVKFAPSPDTYVKTPPVPDTLPADTLPVTDNEVKVPTLVMFDCAADDTVVATVAVDTAPVTLLPATLFAVPAKLTSPDTFAPATEFATCAKGTSPLTLAPATAFAVVAVVANVAKGTSLTFAPVIFVKPAPLPLNDPVPADISILPALVITSEFVFKVPPKINEVKVPTLVIFGCALVTRLPASVAPDTALVTAKLPGIATLPDVLLNVNPVLPAYVVPPSLNIICVSVPCAGTKVAVSHVNVPAPSVLKNAPSTPPVTVTLPTGPKLEVLLKSMLLSNPPDTDIEPVTSTSVPVFLTDNMFAVPAEDTLNGPFVSTVALLVPFTIEEPADTDMLDRPPPSPVIRPVVVKFPASIFPVTFNDVKVPVDVMLGCAAVSTVPDVSAYVAFATAPVTLAPAIEFATWAKGTSPDTFAPATEFATPANPTCPVTLPPATAFAVAANDTSPVTLDPATELALSDDTACVALATAPDTLLPATLFAVPAKLTSPVTFAPAIEFDTCANDTSPVTLAPATVLAVAANVTSPETLAPATLFAVAALVTSPETFAPATAFAVVANETAPETLEPATEFATAAYATSPLTFAPATAFAVAELVTSPVTLAPTIFDNPPPSPENKPVFAVNADAVTVA